ncbi:MAG: FAD-dependent oxidoreductase, partial [Deltaproteobacteria bacterium]|nr:FAD-dependent oxidoreductase [Deltaproteobacteria bacterium]
MLDNTMLVQLKTYLEMLQAPVEVVASLDASSKSQEMRALLDNIAKVSRKIHLRYDGEHARKPSFSVGVPGETARIRFAAVPMGHEFSSLVLALLHTGGHPPKLEPEVVEEIRSIRGSFRFETFISLTCHNCPDVVQALNLMAALNPGISHTMIDGMMFKDEIDQHKIMAVPTIHLNGEFFSQGRKTVEEIIAKIDTGVIAREAGKISAKPVFDVLVVGGGPAGATAAIYASRKGVRTGVVAERFGGQVLDTQTIENFSSVKETDGAKLAAELEEHVRDYDVDIMNLQIAVALTQGQDGLSEIRMASGAVLKSRAIVISTGARWREMNIPGEK